MSEIPRNAIGIELSSEHGVIARYRAWRKNPERDGHTYFWARSDGRGPMGGAVDHDPALPISDLASKVLAAVARRLTEPAPVMGDHSDE